MVYCVDHTLRFILIFFISAFQLNAQSFNPTYNFKHINVQNGLTQNIVYHFLQDSRGYMWIGTHNGLNLFDGTRTSNFLSSHENDGSIGGEFINSVLEDSAQRIWTGNESGIDLYERSTNSFTHFGVDRPDGTIENTYCVALGFVTASDLWFLETKTRSIRSLNTKTRQTRFIAHLNATHAHLYKGSGQTIHIWSAYDKGTIHQVYQNSKLISERFFFTGKDELHKTPELEVVHILQQNDTTVWLSTNKGLVKLNTKNNRYTIFNKWGNQVVKEVRYTALSSKDQIWVATGSSGVYVLDINTNRFIENFRYDKLNPFSICSDNIVSAYFDKTGNFWCGSFGSGASYTHTGNKFFGTHVSKNEVPSWNGNNYIHWFGADPTGNIWCTSDNIPGFLILDKNLQIKKYQLPIIENGSLLNQSMYKLLFESATEVWCTSNKGLFHYNLVTNKLRQVNYPLLSDEVHGSKWIRDIIRLNDGTILFSTFNGLYQITKKTGDYTIAPIRFLKKGAYNGFGELYQDSANFIYVKSLVDSFYILKPATNGKDYKLVKEISFTPLVNQYYSEKNDSLIYLATSEGLYHLNKNSHELEKRMFNNKIPFLNINQLLKKNESFWIFGEKGLYHYDTKTNEARTFTVEDGLPSNEFTLSGLVVTKDGRCITGTSNGLVSFFPEQKQDAIYPLKAQLTGIYVNDTLYTSSLNPNEIKKIRLTYKENTFSFDFAAIAFQHTNECNFEYRLDGYDETWVRSNMANYTRYSKIPPGNYVFNLRVVDAMGKVSPFIKTMEIEIVKAFWQTNIFKTVGALFIMLIGWRLFRWYVSLRLRDQKIAFKKQQAIEKERTRIATDMHDDLGAGLSRIKFLSETIGIKKQKQQSIEEDISKIREYSHEMIDKMGEIVWALNEKNDSLSDLLAYSRSYAVEYLEQNGIQTKIEMPETFPLHFVTGEFRRNVFLTIKEALHNIVKHAQASQVEIKIHCNKYLDILIHDNGIGIDMESIRNYSNGLSNMATRTRQIGGQFKINSQHGTIIKIKIPLHL